MKIYSLLKFADKATTITGVREAILEQKQNNQVIIVADNFLTIIYKTIFYKQYLKN